MLVERGGLGCGLIESGVVGNGEVKGPGRGDDGLFSPYGGRHGEERTLDDDGDDDREVRVD